jgi:hypothetical protein
MNVKLTIDDVINKGIVAQVQLCNVFFRAKINNFDLRMKLFSSLVESIVLYSSQTWAIANIHILRTFQLGFSRRMFHLPNFVPSWFIMLETNLTLIEILFVRKVLYFWMKICLMENSCLVRTCYDALKNKRTCLKRN